MCSGKAGNIVIALDNKGSSNSPFTSVMHIASAMRPRGYGIVVRTDRHARKDVEALVRSAGARPGAWRA